MESSGIVGHEKNLEFLAGVISGDKISHAYLFIGSEHVGKETVARWFGEKIISKPAALVRNLIIMRPEEGLKIADIRSLQHELSLKNPWGGKRVVVMGDINEINSEAQNAFLKLLEEPPVGVVFILLATTFRGILPTIVSRTQLVRFSLVPQPQIKSFIAKRVNTKRAEQLSRLACGKPGWAVTALESENKTSEFEAAADSFIKIFDNSVTEKFKLVQQLIAADKKLPLDSWECVWRDILWWQLGRKEQIVLVAFQDSIKKMAAKLDKSIVLQALRGMQKLRQNLNSNANKKLLLENYLICYS